MSNAEILLEKPRLTLAYHLGNLGKTEQADKHQDDEKNGEAEEEPQVGIVIGLSELLDAAG